MSSSVCFRAVAWADRLELPKIFPRSNSPDISFPLQPRFPGAAGSLADACGFSGAAGMLTDACGWFSGVTERFSDVSPIGSRDKVALDEDVGVGDSDSVRSCC